MGNLKLNRKVYLISEDQNKFRELQEIIRNKGLRLIHDSLNGETVGRIRTIHPDVIFLDAISVREDKLDLLDKIRTNTETETTPIYILGNRVNNHTWPAGNGDGDPGLKFVENPFNLVELNSLVEGISESSIGIKFWGVRGSTPCANKEHMIFGGNTTCVQLELPGSNDFLILDSGTGIRNLGNYIDQYRDQAKGHIFITHPHWDHIQGFPFFKPIYSRENHFDIHMPAQVNGGCREILSGHLTKTFFPVTLEMIDANLEYVTQTESLQRYDGYEIEFMLANHPINTAIYKIHIAGKQVVFCPDNELTPISEKTNAYFYRKFKEFLYGVDVLIHDAQYNRETYKAKVGWGHSAWEDAVDFAIRSNVKNLFLTHHDPDSDDAYLEELDAMIQQDFNMLFDSIQLAKEGARVRIPVSNR